MMRMPAWSATVALTLVWAALSACADEDNYPPPVETHAAHPSSEAIAHKAMKSEDHKLSHDVRKAIAKDGEVEMPHIDVIARSGKVTLLGSVPDDGQIDLATQRALSVAGVTDVVSNLNIAEPGGH
jgi:hyperosmotically inducible protein